MKINKLFVLIPVLSLISSSTAFALEPMEIELKPFQPIDRNLLIEEIAPIEPEVVYTDDPAIFTDLRANLNEDDGSIMLRWDPYLKPDFLWYKILHTQEQKELIYPRDGYLDYYDTPNATSFDHDDAPMGVNFYRVCIITQDNRRGCSNQVKVVKEEPVRPVIEEEKVEPKPDRQAELEEMAKANELKSEGKGNILTGVVKFIGNNSEIIIAILALILGLTGYSFATKKKQRSISKYMNQIDNTYSEFKMKSKRCEAELYRLRDIVDEELKTGKLDEGAYQLLMNRIEGYMVEIQKQIVNEKFGGLPENLKNELFNMMESGDISEKEYEKFQMLINKSELSGNEQSTLLKTVKDFQAQGEKLKRKGSKED